MGEDDQKDRHGEDGIPLDGPLEPPAGIDEARGWIGFKLDELGGSSIGRVEAILVDAGDGSPAWVVAKLGLFGGRSAIPFEFVAAGAGRVWAPFPRETIRAATELDPSHGLSCADERALCVHYEIPPGLGRLPALAGREDDDPSSVPAG